jgi:hypothetical protein
MQGDWVADITYWHWFVLGITFVILEIFTPAAFFLWLGMAAGAVGLLLWAMPSLGWDGQLLSFAGLSVASIVLSRLYLTKNPIKTDQPNLNRRGEQYVGRVFTLDQAIVNGVGKVKVDDSTWKVSGADCPVGERVTVIGVDGVVLMVERMRQDR